MLSEFTSVVWGFFQDEKSVTIDLIRIPLSQILRSKLFSYDEDNEIATCFALSLSGPEYNQAPSLSNIASMLMHSLYSVKTITMHTFCQSLLLTIHNRLNHH